MNPRLLAHLAHGVLICSSVCRVHARLSSCGLRIRGIWFPVYPFSYCMSQLSSSDGVFTVTTSCVGRSACLRPHLRLRLHLHWYAPLVQCSDHLIFFAEGKQPGRQLAIPAAPQLLQA